MCYFDFWQHIQVDKSHLSRYSIVFHHCGVLCRSQLPYVRLSYVGGAAAGSGFCVDSFVHRFCSIEKRPLQQTVCVVYCLVLFWCLFAHVLRMSYIYIGLCISKALID